MDLFIIIPTKTNILQSQCLEKEMTAPRLLIWKARRSKINKITTLQLGKFTFKS